MNLRAVISSVDVGKTAYWGKLIFSFAFVQIFIQGLSFLSGILLIRFLDKADYGYYTIANSMLSTMNILADSGISIGLISIGGKVWQDRYRFGQMINTGLKLRNSFGLVAIVVISPILFWLLYQNQAPILYALALTLTVIIGVLFEFKTAVLSIVFQLHTDVRKIQQVDCLTALFRLAALVLAWAVFLNGLVAVIIASIAFWLKATFFNRSAGLYIEKTAPLHAEDKKAMIGVTKHQIGTTIFYCIQGQLTTWLISIFGNVTSVAEVGALSRLGLIFSILSSVVGNILIPKFARIQEIRLLRNRYFQILSFMLCFNLFLLTTAILFPDYLLWILGAGYRELKAEFLLIICNAALVNVLNTLWALNSSRAWVNYFWVNIPLTILTQIAAIVVIDISTISGVIILNVVSLMPSIGTNIFLTIDGFKKLGLKQTA